MKDLLLGFGLISALGLMGCSGGSDPGDVETAAKAAAAAPKSVDQLPADMPPEAKAAAAAAMGQAQAAQQQANDPARLRAMQEMRKQSGN
jgi:Tfp pilus assembly protein PilP